MTSPNAQLSLTICSSLFPGDFPPRHNEGKTGEPSWALLRKRELWFYRLKQLKWRWEPRCGLVAQMIFKVLSTQTILLFHDFKKIPEVFPMCSRAYVCIGSAELAKWTQHLLKESFFISSEAPHFIFIFQGIQYPIHFTPLRKKTTSSSLVRAHCVMIQSGWGRQSNKKHFWSEMGSSYPNSKKLLRFHHEQLTHFKANMLFLSYHQWW